MQRMTRSILIPAFFALFAVASAQLPPKIMADKHLIHAEQLYAAKDYAEAFKVMEKIIALQKEHDLTLLDEFHFQYAQVTFSTGLFQTAVDAVKKYLAAAGKKGTFYKEALAFLFSS